MDGFHRLEAYRSCGRRTIPAEVAKMSLEEAKDYSKASNGMNGKRYTREDKERLWQLFLADKRHLDDVGELKSSRAIEAELQGRFYSHETIRKKLKVEGFDLNTEVEYPDGYKPYNADDLAVDLADEARESLRDFGSRIVDLDPTEREHLLQAARVILEAAQRGERADLVAILGRPEELLDI